METKKTIIKSILFILFIFISSVYLYKKINTNESYFIETKINTSSYYVESITSVTTTNKKLNNILSDFIQEQKNFFYNQINKKNRDTLIGRDELNIDYKFDYLDKNIWNISLFTSMTGPSFEKSYYKIDCFNFDTRKNEELTVKKVLLDSVDFFNVQNIVFNKVQQTCSDCLFKDEFLKIFTDEFKTFEITNNGIIFYFNPTILKNKYNDVISVAFITDDLVFKKKNKKKEVKNSNKLLPSRVIDYKKKVVALTFDDGPSKYTKEISKILKDNDVCATFFVLGNKVNDYSDVLRELLDNGNEIGNHSYNHKWLSKLSVGELVNQIDKTQNIIYQKLNYTPKYLRPTYGSVTKTIKKNTNLNIVLWTIDTKDWKYHNINTIIKEATINTEDGDIILMHDIFERTKNSLKVIIPKLKDQGFQFVTISELDEVKRLRKLDNNI